VYPLLKYPAPDPTVVVSTSTLVSTFEYPKVWKLQYITRNEGTPSAYIRINFAHIQGSPFALRIIGSVDGPLVPAKSFADGVATQVATAGAPSSFIIHAIAANDLYLTTGGEAFYAELARVDAFARVGGVDHGDGSYTVSYAVTRAGDYTMVVMTGSAHISGSPFTVAVFPSEVSVAHSVIFGDALSVGTAGVEAAFTLEARDRFSNPIPNGNSFAGAFQVTYSGPSTLGNSTSRAKVNAFGSSFVATYNLTVSGAYTLHVAPAAGGPAVVFALRIHPAYISARRTYMVTPSAAGVLPAGFETAFVTPAGEAEVLPAGVETAFVVSVPPAGEALVFPAGVETAFCVTPAGEAVVLPAGVETAFVISARDILANLVDTPRTDQPITWFSCSVAPFGLIPVYAVGPELRLATYVTASGTYQLRVRALDKGVLTEVLGDFMTAGKAGRTASMLLYVKDAFSNPVDEGLEALTVQVSLTPNS
ncbi:hypothetical protein T484DRAFT_1842906, partial [Baffinella frigidus]